MTSLEIWSKVDTYITERLHPQDDVLEQLCIPSEDQIVAGVRELMAF